jgi:hypothetical protein
MKHVIFVPMILLVLSVTAFISCGDGDGEEFTLPNNHCFTDIEGCDPSWYSCPESATCYLTKDACKDSGDCAGWW